MIGILPGIGRFAERMMIMMLLMMSSINTV